MSIAFHNTMQELQGEEKEKAAEMAAYKDQMIIKIGKLITAEAVNVAKKSNATQYSTNFNELSHHDCFTIDEMVTYLKVMWNYCLVKRDNMNIVIDWSS